MKKIRLVPLVRLFVTSLFALNTAQAVLPPNGNAPVDPPPYGFAIDGDLMANVPELNVGDWITNTNLAPGTGGSVLTLAGLPINSNRTFHLRDPYNGNDNIYKGGMKWRDNPNLWEWTTGKPSGKTDINNALLHLTSDTNGHIWVVVAADRYSTAGSSYIDFEFLQSVLTTNANSTFTSGGTNGGRTVGDLLFSLAFVGGGSIAEFLPYRWQTNGAGGFDYADATAMLPAGRFFMGVNTNTISVPYGAFGQTSYAPNAFAEAAIDLTALLGNFDQCATFGFKTIMIKTKSSTSDTSSIEDFITPFQYTLRIGPDAQAGPDQVRCTEGVETVFPLTGTAGSGLSSVVSTTWSVLNGNVTIDETNSLVTTAHVSSASATLRLTVVQANGCTQTDDIVLSVQQPPVCAITGVTNTCPRTTNTFTAPVGMTSYAWSVSGGAFISGAPNQQTVKVVASSTCGTNYTLALNLVSNVCATSCSQDVAVIDMGAPVLVCPTNRVLDCPANTSTNNTGTATATDSCSRVTVTYSDEVTAGCGVSKVIARTWTATDECGNAVSCTQTITVRDITPPVITCPTNRVLQCPADTSAVANGMATAVDACGAATVTFNDVITTNCGNTFVIARTWTATDLCNNSSSCVQTLTVRDTTAPVITCPAAVTLECPADTSTNNTGVATATDACGSFAISFADTVTNNCAQTKVILRRWTATDQCGNSSSCTQTITVRDTTPPAIVCPPDAILECPAVTTTNVTGVATATDECGSVTITVSDTTTNLCGNTKVIARKWTATDSCGNKSSCTQTIRVVDLAPPVIICAADKTVECTVPWTFNAPTATDTCGTNSIAIVSTTTNATCGNTFIATRTWRATDACGNQSTCSQTVTVVDTTPPMITCSSNKTVECTVAWTFNTPTATDTCGTNRIDIVGTVTNSTCGYAFIATRTWRATDACGNQSQCSQTVTVVDTTPPVITCSSNKTVQCTTPWIFDAPTASDTCGTSAITVVNTTTNGTCGSAFVATRIWRATDACGNTAQCSQTVTIIDTVPPVITCANNKTVECTVPWTFDAPTANDTCGTNAIAIVSTTTNKMCGNTFTATRTWRSTDACGNQATCSQTVTVVDTTAPMITCLGNKTVQCSTPWTFDAPSASDTCGTNSIAIVNTTTNAGCGNTFIATRTWRTTDACGNQATCSQTVTVIDTIAPVITCPASVTLNCPAVTTTNATGVATATDTCGTPVITFSDSTVNNCGNTKVISRTWRATDPCGNSSTCVQTITVRDLTPPTITGPTNVTVECGASIAPSATGTATAADACNSVTVNFSDSVSNSCGNARTILRRWLAMDSCNNSNVAMQTITVRDTTPPTLTLPSNRLLNCPGNTNTSNTGMATATDVCSGVTISYSDVVSNSCGITKTVWRTWTAVDQCGNAANGTQTIQVQDTPPTISCPTINVQCVNDVPPPYTNIAAFRAAGGVANDPCDVDLSFMLVSNSVLVGSCPARMTRVYRVTDDCGLTAQCSQTIIVDDTIAPTLTCPPGVTVECGASIDPAVVGNATATDNCSAVVITNTDNPVGSFYNLKWYGSDPEIAGGPYSPTYLRLGPASLPCPTGGRAIDPLRNAVCYAPGAQLDALTSLGGVPLSYGQVVPFQLVIEVSGAPGAEKGVIEVTPSWSTHTTSNDRFGFDTNYMVYCAFVDPADPGSIDPHFNAKVDSLNSYLFDRGTINEQIRGKLQISGLDPGDRVIVEIWMVMQTTQPDHVGGTIASELTAARKLSIPAEDITIGNETISIGNLSKFTALPPPQPQPPQPPIPPQPPVPPGRTTSVVDRTWTATDDCGNRSICVQRITVRDTTAPSLLAPNLVLECPADTSTNGTGRAAVVDTCGLVTLGYSDVVSNSCGNTRTILRTWTAYDDNNNSNSVVQTISVTDTTAPTLSSVNPKSIAAGVAIVFDMPIATDTCGSASVVEVSTVTNALTEASYTITRTWVAVDVCGNKSAPQSQVVTVNALVITPLNRLTISRNGASGVLLRWPTNAVNYRLECSTTADGKRWSPVAITPIVTNGECRVYMSKSGHCQLFRLANSAPYLESQKMGGNLRLTWPTAPSGFQLEASDTLAPGSWASVAITPGVSNTLNHVNVPAAGAKKFYRLRK